MGGMWWIWVLTGLAACKPAEPEFVGSVFSGSSFGMFTVFDGNVFVHVGSDGNFTSSLRALAGGELANVASSSPPEPICNSAPIVAHGTTKLVWASSGVVHRIDPMTRFVERVDACANAIAIDGDTFYWVDVVDFAPMLVRWLPDATTSELVGAFDPVLFGFTVEDGIAYGFVGNDLVRLELATGERSTVVGAPAANLRTPLRILGEDLLWADVDVESPVHTVAKLGGTPVTLGTIPNSSGAIEIDDAVGVFVGDGRLRFGETVGEHLVPLAGPGVGGFSSSLDFEVADGFLYWTSRVQLRGSSLEVWRYPTDGEPLPPQAGSLGDVRPPFQ